VLFVVKLQFALIIKPYHEEHEGREGEAVEFIVTAFMKWCVKSTTLIDNMWKHA